MWALGRYYATIPNATFSHWDWSCGVSDMSLITI